MKNLREKRFKKSKNSHERIEQRNLERPDKVVDDLDSTEDREASEKAHGAPYQTQLGLHSHLQNWVDKGTAAVKKRDGSKMLPSHPF